MYSLTKNLFPQSVFVTDLEQTPPLFLRSDLNINNFAVLLHFEITEIFSKISGNKYFRPSLFYQTTTVFLAFTKRIVYHFYHKCAIQH